MRDMRDISATLGWLVAGVVGAGCGSSEGVPGRIAADGTVTAAEPREIDGKCQDSEEATYLLDPAISCDVAYALARQCSTKVCQNGETSCSGYDADRKIPFGRDNDGFLEGCRAGTLRMARIDCFRTTGSYSCSGPIDGRRPAGLRAIDTKPLESLASYFASSAHLEAAAVIAFDNLAIELRAHHAPAALVRRLHRAAREEERHVVLAARLARRFGAEPLVAVADPIRARSLLEIAIENVVEGVVRETYAAAVVSFRAECAGDLEVRAAAADIARDERGHAQLSWDMHTWLCSRLAPHELAQVEAARETAIEELRAETRAEPNATIADLAGVPSADDAASIFEAIFERLWTIRAA